VVSGEPAGTSRERVESSQWSLGAAGLYTASDIPTSDPHRLSQAARTVALADVRRVLYLGSMGDEMRDHPPVHLLAVRCGFAGLSPS
jgi:hypothetical protein